LPEGSGIVASRQAGRQRRVAAPAIAAAPNLTLWSLPTPQPIAAQISAAILRLLAAAPMPPRSGAAGCAVAGLRPEPPGPPAGGWATCRF